MKSLHVVLPVNRVLASHKQTRSVSLGSGATPLPGYRHPAGTHTDLTHICPLLPPPPTHSFQTHVKVSNKTLVTDMKHPEEFSVIKRFLMRASPRWKISSCRWKVWDLASLQKQEACLISLTIWLSLFCLHLVSFPITLVYSFLPIAIFHFFSKTANSLLPPTTIIQVAKPFSEWDTCL